MRVAMIVEYDGARYAGFQRQRNAPTVQAEMEKATAETVGAPTAIRAAGRTDSGVHARGQVVAFDADTRLSPQTLARAIDSRLPQDIAIRAAHQVAEDFDPRRDAKSRLYRYTLLASHTRSPLARRTAHRVRPPLRLDRMRAAAALMEGTRDFRNFGKPPEGGASAVRRVDSVAVEERGEFISVSVEGSAFLRRQVRRMAGALVDAAQGRLSVDDVRRQVSARPDAPTARALPPNGLCLMEVKYDGFPPKKRNYHKCQ